MGRIQRTLIHETGDFCQAELWDNQNRAQHGTVSRQSADITDTVKEMDFLLWTDFYGKIMSRQRKAFPGKKIYHSPVNGRMHQNFCFFGKRREP